MTEVATFIAYPSNPAVLGSTIDLAVQELSKRFGEKRCTTWRETDVAGSFIAKQILDAIDARDAIVADITRPNFNVTYEIGFAIGRGKRLLLIKNSALVGDEEVIPWLGVFDTIGYKEYTNADELLQHLRCVGELQPIHTSATRLNSKAPVYLLDALYKTDSITRIIARVKKARLFYRSFDPHEQPRMSGFDAIQNVAQSYGVLLSLIPTHFQDSRLHNLRAAFLAGLSTGMGKVLLFLQDGNEPVPLDFRDLVVPFFDPGQIDRAIADFALRVTEALQAETTPAVSLPRTFLESLSLGASSAENELRDLAHYYLEIDAFQRAKRGEARIVVGRKGSGKTALFLQLRDEVRPQKGNVVLDLKPEGYKLLKFKETVLDLLEEGTVEHTLTAFWEYLLFLEICRKILENDRERHTRDPRLYQPYRQLADAYDSDEYVSEGDFSERMSSLLQRIGEDFAVMFPDGKERRLSQPQVTQLLYRHNLASLRDRVVKYLRFKDGLWLLFDNLDKGWPAHGIRCEDLIILRTLLEATRKIERELSQREIEAYTLVFLRNDVFELLVEETPDRGKEAKVTVDWTDADLLRELIRRRLHFSVFPEDESFEEMWRRICVSHIDGEETSQYLIDRSLMRPRCLIDLINHCRSCAVNLGHTRIEVEDIRKGLALYSTDLIFEIDLEIRDVFPQCEDILYALIDTPARMSQQSHKELLSPFRLTDEQAEKLLDILLWYGVIGIVLPDGEVQYIYSVNYDMRYLRGKLEKLEPGGVVYEINSAFWPGLGIHGN